MLLMVVVDLKLTFLVYIMLAETMKYVLGMLFLYRTQLSNSCGSSACWTWQRHGWHGSGRGNSRQRAENTACMLGGQMFSAIWTAQIFRGSLYARWKQYRVSVGWPFGIGELYAIAGLASPEEVRIAVRGKLRSAGCRDWSVLWATGEISRAARAKVSPQTGRWCQVNGVSEDGFHENEVSSGSINSVQCLIVLMVKAISKAWLRQKTVQGRLSCNILQYSIYIHFLNLRMK